MTNLQTLAIYFSNLSGFYIFSFFVSIFAVFFTFYLMKFSTCFDKNVSNFFSFQFTFLIGNFFQKNKKIKKPLTKEEHLQEETFKKFFKDEKFFDSSDDDQNGLVGKLKSARLKAIEETLSVEQKVKEKE